MLGLPPEMTRMVHELNIVEEMSNYIGFDEPRPRSKPKKQDKKKLLKRKIARASRRKNRRKK
ncbi:hypothetical protein KAR91_80775 [Candidatus Pacearchaeota archaeon]|nr:hypothetical protein [Candidatus Pacearchaeota archaeon]